MMSLDVVPLINACTTWQEEGEDSVTTVYNADRCVRLCQKPFLQLGRLLLHVEFGVVVQQSV